MNRLEIVGALEEGILTIERMVVQHGMRDNEIRDIALSKLYTTYAKVLMNLDAQECLQLASDQHTLLIGVDSFDKDNPTTDLCISNAENSFRNAESLDTTNMEAIQFIKRITDDVKSLTHDGKSKEFVAQLFDSFAETFDEQLLNALEYKVPRLIGEWASKLLPSSSSSSSNYGAALDAGCGTGLAGRYLRSLVPNGPIIGVDLSSKMLDKAKRCTSSSGCGLPIKDPSKKEKDVTSTRALYDGLAKMDLEKMTIPKLIEETGISNLTGFDIVVAADVLVYFGSLDNLLEVFASISLPGALLILSCEYAATEEAPMGWKLQPQGRFGHTKNYVVGSAQRAGYSLVQYEEITPRIEKGEPVKGHLFAFQLQINDDETMNVQQAEEL